MIKEKNQEIINLCDKASNLVHETEYIMFREEINNILFNIKKIILYCKTEEIKMSDKEWKNIYACYVIRELKHGYYISFQHLFVESNTEASEIRCIWRNDATRFTKQQAMDFIKTLPSEKFIIEDAK